MLSHRTITPPHMEFEFGYIFRTLDTSPTDFSLSTLDNQKRENLSDKELVELKNKIAEQKMATYSKEMDQIIPKKSLQESHQNYKEKLVELGITEESIKDFEQSEDFEYYQRQ